MGAKGGFVVKQPPADREALREEVVESYRTLIRGLLDVTDNLVAGAPVPPPDVVRYDGDDPYLVVAADKGTATFSDVANGIAADYGFWLGDAFASGGSAGYDHKEMGITARGAWESVTRHFRELGVDVQATDFTAVGIGDMAGDVFGNGMLLSRHLKLVAAFNHEHVFLDPDPDPEASFAERARLFALPRSSWADYDAAAISTGGGVFPRTAKSIELSPEARRALGIEAEALAPNELIRAILHRPGRPLLERRHRHLRQGLGANRTSPSATRPTTRFAWTAATCAPGWSARAATSASPRKAGSSSRWPAAASTRTRSTTRRESTAPTTRSTSRSCSMRSWPRAT